MLVVIRQDSRLFGAVEQTLLEAISDYVSISLLNARLFRALNTSALASKESEKRQNALRSSIAGGVQSAIQPLDLLLEEKPGSLTESQRQALHMTRAALQRLTRAVEKTTPRSP